MCLLVLAWNAHPRYRLVVAANRDEYHDRAAAPLAPWAGPVSLLAGRDLRAGGTWLGIDARRRFGVITNFRDLAPAPAAAPSRGGLIPRYLGGSDRPGTYLEALEGAASGYGGFNLLLADDESLWYASNRGTPFARELPPGVYGLSNERLDTPWPKLRRVREGFERWLPGGHAEDGALFALLEDRRPAGDGEDVPSTGLAPEWERILSSPFVLNERYGTRCSTIVAIEPSGRCYLAERRFDPTGARSGESEYRLDPAAWLTAAADDGAAQGSPP
jgi:uncharacterized protein with NRDE domain